MCKSDFPGTGIPAGSFELLNNSMTEFLGDPSSWQKFEQAEWAAAQFAAKMSTYATQRRCAAGAKWRPPIAPCAEARVSAPFQRGGPGPVK